jgi:hypothetical protein
MLARSFESKITTQGLCGTAISLTQTDVGATNLPVNIPAGLPVTALPTNNLGDPLVNAFAAATGQGNGSYLLPSLPNFPVLGAMYVPPGASARGLMLQMKAGRSKPLAGEFALTLFAVSRQGDLLFVVPNEMHMRRKLPWSGRAVGRNIMMQFRYVLKED